MTHDSAEAPAARADSTPQLAKRIEELRRGGRNHVSYIPPTASDEHAYRSWSERAVRAAREGGPPPLDAPLGFALERLVGAGELWLLAEAPEHRRGAGVLVLRAGLAARCVVEAPHTFFDAGTLPIALTAFDRGQCGALLVNTVHRYASERDLGDAAAIGNEDEASGESDVAHATHSFFLTAHEELVHAWPDALTIQLHGFADANVENADVVISAASTTVDVAPIVGALRETLSLRALAYPSEVRALGGTTNMQARASRVAGSGFVHVEIARALRERLTRDDVLRASFVDALLRGANVR